MYDISFHYLLEYLPLTVKAFETTIIVCLVSMFLSALWGTFLALMQLSPIRILSFMAYWYIAVIRSTPFLVHIYFIFFGLPSMGIILPAITVGIISLVINSGAYNAEIIRAGIESIPKAQFEAGKALAFSNIQTMRYIILPQAYRNILPPLTGQLSILIKDSSLLSVMGVMELTKTARYVQDITFRPIESFSPSIISYLVMITLILQASNLLEKKWRW